MCSIPWLDWGNCADCERKSRQAYYQHLWQQEQNDKQQMAILAQVVKIREQLPGVGTGKLHHLLTDFLAEQQIKLGRDKLYDLLREHHLLRTKRRKRARTTNYRASFLQVGKPRKRVYSHLS